MKTITLVVAALILFSSGCATKEPVSLKDIQGVVSSAMSEENQKLVDALDSATEKFLREQKDWRIKVEKEFAKREQLLEEKEEEVNETIAARETLLKARGDAVREGEDSLEASRTILGAREDALKTKEDLWEKSEEEASKEVSKALQSSQDLFDHMIMKVENLTKREISALKREADNLSRSSARIYRVEEKQDEATEKESRAEKEMESMRAEFKDTMQKFKAVLPKR